MSGLIGFLRRITGDERGNTAIIFALSILPVMLLVGAAVDLSGMHGKRSSLQSALDAAALAAAKMPYNSSDADVIETATNFANANYSGKINNLQVDRTDDSVIVNGESPAELIFLSGFGFGDKSVSTTAVATRGAHKIEVVMVLDNSGSMRGNKLVSLKRSAKALVETLTQADPEPGMVKIGLVPFTAAVNVGAQHRNSDWIDHRDRADQHDELFDSDLNRFDLFDMLDRPWAGCVETREYPYDVTDELPRTSSPDTLFQPYFAPDEPDYDGYYPNNYMLDWPCSEKRGNSYRRCERDHPEPWWHGSTNFYALKAAQLYSEKYQEGDVYNRNSPAFGGVKVGPNFMCDSEPLTPMTENFRDMVDSIHHMKADGNTNVHEGVAWGWRLLSPSAPFTEGAAYDDEETKKFLILLTDGANNINARYNHNGSIYSPYGFAYAGRFDDTPNSTYEIRKEMDSRTEETCENAKATGITVFTIAFDVNDDDIEDLMKGCASGENRYFLSPSTSDLEVTFEAIANEITELRLSQ